MPPKQEIPAEPPSRRAELWFIVVTLVLYIALTTWLAVHHETWRDEADTWLMVRDGGLAQTLARAGYAGTPVLWYVLIWPFAKLGAPYVAQVILNLVTMWIAALILLIQGPFPRITKVAFLLSVFALHEYAAIARPYSLMVLLLFWAACGWNDIARKPFRVAVPLALLANTTVHGLLVAFLLGLLWLVDVVRRSDRTKRELAALALLIVAGLIAAWQIRTPADSPYRDVTRAHDPINARWAVSNAFFPATDDAYMIIPAIGILVLVTIAARRRVPTAVFLWASIGILSAIFSYVWFGGPRHAGLILVLTMFVLWIIPDTTSMWRRAAVVAVSAALIISLHATITVWNLETKEAYSEAEEMAGFLREHRLTDVDIAIHTPDTAAAVLLHLEGATFWSPALNRRTSYLTWDNALHRALQMTPEAAAQAAREQLGPKPWLLMLSEPANARVEELGFVPLYATRGRPFGTREEAYGLYADSRWATMLRARITSSR